jgi:hypothetical protein
LNSLQTRPQAGFRNILLACALPLCLLLSACQSQSVPAERMNDEELAKAIEQSAGLKEDRDAEPPARLLALQERDVGGPFKLSAICSFSNAAGMLILATPKQALVRFDGGPAVLPAAGPVIPDGGFFRAGSTSLSVGLGARISDLPRIAAGGAEARITIPDRREATVRGSWTCKLGRP